MIQTLVESRSIPTVVELGQLRRSVPTIRESLPRGRWDKGCYVVPANSMLACRCVKCGARAGLSVRHRTFLHFRGLANAPASYVLQLIVQSLIFPLTLLNAVSLLRQTGRSQTTYFLCRPCAQRSTRRRWTLIALLPALPTLAWLGAPPVALIGAFIVWVVLASCVGPDLRCSKSDGNQVHIKGVKPGFDGR